MSCFYKITSILQRVFFVFTEAVRKCSELANATTGMGFFNSRRHKVVRVLLLLYYGEASCSIRLFPFAELTPQFQ